MHLGTNLFYTQMERLLQFLDIKVVTPIASAWLQWEGNLLSDFVFILILFQKHYKVSYEK